MKYVLVELNDVTNSMITDAIHTEPILYGAYRLFKINDEFSDYFKGYHKHDKAGIDLEIATITSSASIVKNKTNKEVKVEPYPFKKKSLPDGRKVFEQGFGIKQACIIGMNTIEFEIPYVCKFNEIEIINGTVGDEMDFTISQLDDTVIFKHGDKVNIPDGSWRKKGEYMADLAVGVKFVIGYNSVEVATKRINIILHMIV